MAFPKHHGIELAKNSWFANLVFEPLTADPATLAAGRAWLNTTENKFKYAVDDGTGTIIVRSFANMEEVQASLNALQSELDATQAGAGLGADGAYTAPAGSNYLGAATSLADADSKLDTQAKANADAIASETTARSDADAAIQSELDATQAGAGLGTDGTYTAPAVSNYLAGAASLADADQKLDSAVKTVADNAAADAATKVSKSGDAMTGNLVMQAGTHITITDQPSDTLHAVNVAYVDARLNGLSWKKNVELATTGPVDLAATVAPTIDGVVVADGNRILVKDQANAAENGIYVFTAGTGFARAVDADEATELHGATVLAIGGASLSNTSWTCPLDSSAVVGTDPINFVQHNGASSIVPGVGLTKSGNQLDINLGAGIGQLPTDEVGIDARADGGLFLTEDGATESTGTNAQLAIKVDGTTLTKSVNGIKVADTVLSDIASKASQTEVDATQAGAGLGADGSYTAPAGSNYLGAAVSLADADSKLDAQAKANADAISSEQSRAQAAEGNIQSELDATQAGAGLGADGAYAPNAAANYIATAASLKDADDKLDGQLKSTTDRVATLEANSGSGANALKTQINGGRYTFQSTAAALSFSIAHNLNTSFYQLQVMVEGTDGVYRNDVVPVEEDSADPKNKLTITLSEAHNIKVAVQNLEQLA